MKALIAKVLALVYPPTKAKLHKLVSYVGTALTLTVIVWSWLVSKHVLTVTEALGVDLTTLTIFLSSWRSVVAPKVNAEIDGLDIPDGSTVEQKSVTVRETTVTTPAGAVSTGVDRSEDITAVHRSHKRVGDPTDSGHATPTIFFLVVFGTLAICAGIALAETVPAAPTPTGNGIILAIPVPPGTGVVAPAAPKVPSVWNYGPSVSAAVAFVNLKTGDYMAGLNAIPLGACVGVTYLPQGLGVDGCFNLQVGTSKPNVYFPSFMLHWHDWVNGGIGWLGTQKADHTGVFFNFLLLLGGRLGVLGG